MNGPGAGTTVPTRRSSARHGRGAAVLAGVGWLCLGSLPLLLDTTAGRGRWGFDGTVLFGVLSVLFGLWVFWRDGGARVTTVGAYNLGFALFVGFAALYQALESGIEAPEFPLFRAVALGYFVQVSTWLVFWTGKSTRATAGTLVTTTPEVARWAVRCGALLLALAVLLQLSLPERFQHLLISSAGFVGVIMLGVGLLPTTRRRPSLMYGLVPVAGLVIYYLTLFDSFGRLVLGALALALAVIVANRGNGRPVKAVMLAVAPPTLAFLAKIRASPTPPPPGTPRTEWDSDGLFSVVGPFHDFAQLLSLSDLGLLPKAWGESFYAAAVILVPRSIWEDKPRGLGAVLVPYLSPQLAGTEHSDAALFFGEWLYNFGLAGLVLMIPITGLALRAADRVVRAASKPLIGTRRGVLAYVAAIVLLVGALDLIWVGTATFASRAGCRLLILAALFAVHALFSRAPTAVPPQSPPSPSRPVPHSRLGTTSTASPAGGGVPESVRQRCR
ncbi:hypothetical protein ACFYO8_08210 [Micromonospora sp. NPDC005257]|uniref:hypothetical protein n=1 Tax=unclassified Micromonospora TaxID=2617518 RepID=UPI003401D540